MQALRTVQYCSMKRSTAYFLFCMRFSLYVRTAFYWFTSHFHSSVCFTLSLQRILRPWKWHFFFQIATLKIDKPFSISFCGKDLGNRSFSFNN